MTVLTSYFKESLAEELKVEENQLIVKELKEEENQIIVKECRRWASRLYLEGYP